MDSLYAFKCKHFRNIQNTLVKFFFEHLALFAIFDRPDIKIGAMKPSMGTRAVTRPENQRVT
jgi:hypothetical protein